MSIDEAHPTVQTTNPRLRALVKQIADLIRKARAEQALLEALETWTAERDLENLAREVDARWQTIEQLADQLFDQRPSGLDEAAAQASVGLALSNADHWDEDHALTAVARTLAASGRSRLQSADLSDAVFRIAEVADAGDPPRTGQDGR